MRKFIEITSDVDDHRVTIGPGKSKRELLKDPGDNCLYILVKGMKDKWRMRQLIRIFIKIFKIICASYLTIFFIGFILPTHIRENAISVYDAFSNAENVPIDLWAYLIITLSLILWFGIKTLHRLFLTKGNIKKFWNEI